MGFDVEEDSGEEGDRKIAKPIQPWELEENNMDTFLYRLKCAVQKIDQYKEHVGLDKGERKMKMQGVLREDCKIDLQKHFAKHDDRAEQKAIEQEKQRQQDEKESKTTVGAVKRLIQKFSSLSINNDNIMGEFGQTPKRKKRRPQRRDTEQSQTDVKSNRQASSFSHASGGDNPRGKEYNLRPPKLSKDAMQDPFLMGNMRMQRSQSRDSADERGDGVRRSLSNRGKGYSLPELTNAAESGDRQLAS